GALTRAENQKKDAGKSNDPEAGRRPRRGKRPDQPSSRIRPTPPHATIIRMSTRACPRMPPRTLSDGLSRESEQFNSDHSDGFRAARAGTMARATSFLRAGRSTMQLRFAALIAATCTACGARTPLGVSDRDNVRDAADAPNVADGPDAADAPDVHD